VALDGRRVTGTYGHYTVTKVHDEGEVSTNGLGLFLQDAWTIGHNLTLFDPLSIAAATPASYRPEARYRLPNQYQSRRTRRLNVNWLF
jgi:hypothetical protein